MAFPFLADPAGQIIVATLVRALCRIFQLARNAVDNDCMMAAIATDMAVECDGRAINKISLSVKSPSCIDVAQKRSSALWPAGIEARGHFSACFN